MREVICKKCHNSLKKCVLPRCAVSSPVKPSRCNVMRCIICSLHLADKMHIFRRSTYGDNPKLDCALHQRDVHYGSVICQKCHSQFTRTSMYSCFVCNLLTQRRNTVEYNPGEFARLSANLSPEQRAHQGSRVCRACHARAKYGVYNCLVCCRSVPKKSALVYSSDEYDFDSLVVARCIPSAEDDTDNNKHICIDGHSTLVSCTDEKPVVPKHVKNPVLRSSVDFLMSLSEHPRYVCTCCHRMLFSRTVAKFNIADYNMTNPIVRDCLSHRIALKFEIETDVAKFISAAKDMVARGLREHILTRDISGNEFICIRCKNSLRAKKPKMPDQACANGLALDVIPDELANMFPIERRVLSFRIPFITLIVIHRYGGHYKINGPPVNVPATLDQIARILPRMPGELQLHPLKLKRKLEYKSHYMYDMIRKDKVIGAIMWLKEHNKHYESVPIDTTWLENEIENDVPVLPCEGVVDEVGNYDPSLSPCFSGVDTYPNVSTTGIHGTKDCGLTVVQAENPQSKAIHDRGNPKGLCTDEINNTVIANEESVSEQIESEQVATELVEDQAEINRRQETTGDPLPAVVQFDNLENVVFNCAPGENNIPKYILLDEQFEELAFPDLFPYGSGGYYSKERQCRLPIRKYFQQQLLNVDGRFAKNIEYIFCAQYISDIQQIQSDANLAIRLSRGHTLNGQNITAGLLRDTESLQQLIRTEQAYKFLKNIHGSPAYWQSELYDVLAMLRSLGIPTFFLTLSAADLHWPEMIQAIGAECGMDIPTDVVRKMTVTDKSWFLRQNPLTGVRKFHGRVESFFSRYLLSPSNPLGHITDHVIKIEFQMRGSPHAHCLLWVKDAPKIDRDDDSVVCKFIDKYISARVPEAKAHSAHDRELMTSLQRHTHSDYCRRGKKCRFGFPKPPSSDTVIARKPDDDNGEAVTEHARVTLKMVQDALHKDKSDLAITIAELLHDIGVSPDAYAESVKVTSRGPTVVLQCALCDVYTNSCNTDILRLWGANVDLQYVTNEVATVMYVCSYMTKGEKAMGETLKRVSKECRNDDMRTQMNKIKKEFLGKRVIGAPESCMRVLSLWLMKKSRKVIYVNSNMKHERVSLPKTRAQLEKMHPDDDDVFATSLIDRYMARPTSLEKMCLALFAVTYDVVSGISQQADESMYDDLVSREKPGIIKLHNGLGYMRKRKRQSILRVKHFRVATEPERYYHSKLILYFPWAREEDLLDGFPSYHASYHSKITIIQPNADMFNDDCDVFDISPDNADHDRTDNTVWDLVAPSIAQDDALTNKSGFSMVQDNAEGEQADGRCSGTANDSPFDIQSRLYYQAASKQGMLLREYCEHIRNLNAEQRRVVLFNRQWCKSFVHQQRLGKNQDGYKIFLSGCGGTGKSHVVRLIQRDTAYLLQHVLRPDPDQPIVLVTAPTGSAAYNINGSTIHSALSINDRTKAVLPYEKQCLMQVKLEHLMLLITDENKYGRL